LPARILQCKYNYCHHQIDIYVLLRIVDCLWPFKKNNNFYQKLKTQIKRMEQRMRPFYFLGSEFLTVLLQKEQKMKFARIYPAVRLFIKKTLFRPLWICIFLTIRLEVLSLPLSLPPAINDNEVFLGSVTDSLRDNASMTHVFGINIGQGALFIGRKEGKIFIADAGTIKHELINDSNFRQDLRGKGNRAQLITKIFEGGTLSEIFITHADSDHYNVMRFFLEYLTEIESFSIASTIKILIGMQVNTEISSFPKPIEACIAGINYYNEKKALQVSHEIYLYDNSRQIKKRAFKWETNWLNQTDESSIDGLFSIGLLISEQNIENMNRNSFSLIFNRNDILYTGDANGTTCSETDIKNFANKNKEAKGMVIPHHGSATEGTFKICQWLVNNFSFMFYIIPVGTDPKFKEHPNLPAIFNIKEEETDKIAEWRKRISNIPEVAPHEIIIKGSPKKEGGYSKVVKAVPVPIYETSMPQGISALCFKFDNSGKVFVYDHDNEHKWLELIKPCVPQSGETHSYEEEEAA
jgi:beta-lactamase superfamily II metal-dependent hydrolase